MLYIEQHVPYSIINQDFYDRIEQAKIPLVQIYHYHCNHLGTPQELTNQDGDVIWLSYDRAWGGSFDTIYKPQFIDNWAISESELQPIKFQGQSLDTETGLHYNRFRYYDSDVGMFISRDPIGLMGGNNIFQYAPNPVGWIDPWGLSNLDSTGRPLNSPFYSVWYETAIPENLHSSGRPVHFRDANQQLYNHILANPELSKILPPEVVAHVHPGVRGGFSDRSPPNHTWHHNAYDPSRIELVPRGQHRAPGAVQQSLHPNQGGGFKQLQATKC